jgi:hypothetical protein
MSSLLAPSFTIFSSCRFTANLPMSTTSSQSNTGWAFTGGVLAVFGTYSPFTTTRVAAFAYSTVVGCTFQSNRMTSTGLGAGIVMEWAYVIVQRTTFNSQYSFRGGAAIDQTGGYLYTYFVTFTNGQSATGPGAYRATTYAYGYHYNATFFNQLSTSSTGSAVRANTFADLTFW